jgi:F-type H+-transporting ATPase subunit epsilon
MRLMITTPTAMIADLDNIRHIRAEDDTGAFGIMPGHANFLTALTISVLSWRDVSGVEGHVAVRGGVLRVDNGDRVEVATREALVGDDLYTLETTVLRSFREDQDREDRARSTTAQLELAAIRHIREFLHPGEKGAHRMASSIPAIGSNNHQGTER